MKEWPVQNTKNELTTVVERARTEGPQTITLHGKAMAVVVAANEFKKLPTTGETPLEFFSRFKGIASTLVRRKDLPRNIER
jgi:antitoxin Phd